MRKVDELRNVIANQFACEYKAYDLGLARDLNMVYSCLDLRPKNPDYIVRKTGFSPAQVSNCLVELTLRGLIRESGRHYYVKDS